MAVDEAEPITHVLGTSIGAVNGALLSYIGREGMVDHWLSMRKRSEVLKTHFWKFLINKKTGWFNMDPLEGILEDVILENDARIPAWAAYVDFKDPKLVHVQNVNGWEAEYIEAILRSSAVIPVHELRQDRYGDGGYMQQTPLQFAIDQGAKKISVFMTGPLEWPQMNGWEVSGLKPLNAGLRGIDIILHQNFRRDVLKCLEKNKKPGYRKIDLKIYTPSRILSEIKSDDIQPEIIKKLLWEAYKETKDRLDGKV